MANSGISCDDNVAPCAVTVDQTTSTTTTTAQPTTTNDEGDTITLNLVDCLGLYQMSELQIVGKLTDGRQRDLSSRSDVFLLETTVSSAISLDSDDRLVSGQSAGSSEIYAVLNGSNVDPDRDDYTSNEVTFTVTDETADIESMELSTFEDRDQLFEDLIASTELLNLEVTFSDGVVIPDILHEIAFNDLWTGSSIDSLFNFSSTDPAVVAVSDDGNVTLLDNWWRAVNVSVDTLCGASSVVSAAESIYPNLRPDRWDIDIEAPSTESGLQFSNKDVDGEDSFLWNIYVNATNGTLLSFSVRIWWDDDLFIENGTDECSYFEDGDRASWPQCEAAGDWEGQMLSWNLDTIRGELRLAGASSTGSSTASSLQHVATCNLRVNSGESEISQVVGRVIEITFIDDADGVIKHVYDEPIVSGKGYQQINSGDSVAALPSNIQSRFDAESSIQYECSAETDDEYLFSSNEGSSSLCCDWALFGDVNLDCRTTAFDSEATSLFLIDTASQSPYSTLALEELSHSQRIAMDQSLDYLQDDGNLCSDPSASNPCPNGLEDVWYGLQVSTGKFLYLNVSARTDTLVQDGKQIKGFAPMFIQEYSNLFRHADSHDATVFFELKNVSTDYYDFFVGNGALLKGEVVPMADHGLNTSILIRGEFVDGQYWTFETDEFDWDETNQSCIEMSILYETYDESTNCTQIDREYAFRGTKYFGDSFSEFTELCIEVLTNDPTTSPTEAPTDAPTNEDRGPELMDCRFEDHGTAILAYFSEDTNRAGFGGKPFSCLSVGNPATFTSIEGSTRYHLQHK